RIPDNFPGFYAAGFSLARLDTNQRVARMATADPIAKCSFHDFLLRFYYLFDGLLPSSVEGRAFTGGVAVSLVARGRSIARLSFGARRFYFAWIDSKHRHLQRSTTRASVSHGGQLFPSCPSKALLPIELP